MAEDKLPEIDLAQLEAVTGGAVASEQVTAVLQSLLSSIKDLAESRNNSGNQFMQMLPFIMMLRGRQEPVQVVAAAPSPGDGWIRVA